MQQVLRGLRRDLEEARWSDRGREMRLQEGGFERSRLPALQAAFNRHGPDRHDVECTILAARGGSFDANRKPNLFGPASDARSGLRERLRLYPSRSRATRHLLDPRPEVPQH